MKMYAGFFVIALAWGFIIADFTPEKPCTDAGGVCTHKSLCPHSPFVEGLCPKQQKDGAECCYEPAERPCRSIGGECIHDCPPRIISPVQCPAGKQCCVWRK